MWSCTSVLVLASVLAAIATSAQSIELPFASILSSSTKSGRKQGIIHEFVNVTFDFTGSPWGSAEAAKAAGWYTMENNVVTGVNEYNGTIYVCIPRWRRGVPATLTEVVPGENGAQPYLRAWPSWDFNTNPTTGVRYVQSIWIDQEKGWMYIIDTGRENFFSANLSTAVNGHAKLTIMDIPTKTVVKHIVFPDSIFPVNSSFLNDIVLDAKRNVAYMSDTNTAGHGAVVMHDFNTGHSARFSGPSTLAEPWYKIHILNVSYPINNPVDGITLSDDGNTLFYSVIEGPYLFKLDAAVFRNPNSTTADIQATVQNITRKASFSDGLRTLPMPPITINGKNYEHNRVAYGAIGHCAVHIVDMYTNGTEQVVIGDSQVKHSDEDLQWVDTFAFVPTPGFRYQGTLYFTSNRLQRYFARNWDLSGGEGANMRIFRFDYGL